MNEIGYSEVMAIRSMESTPEGVLIVEEGGG